MSSKIAMGVGALLATAAVAYFFVNSNNTAPTDISMPQQQASTEGVSNPTAVLSTSMGDIEIELFADKTPKAVQNFVKLSNEGFYNETKFHRVIAGFMVQGGDPNTKTNNAASYGTGGPGYTIEDEFVQGLSNVRGTISMANVGQPNSGGSQFFINLVDNTYLDFDKPPMTSRHPVFGKVVKGMEVIDAIAKTSVDERDMPKSPIVVRSVTIK